MNNLRKQLFFLFISLAFIRCNEVVLIVDEIPSNTPPNDAIFVSGSFNNWKEADYNYLVKELEDGRHGVVLPALQGKIQYKFSRGSWLTVETDSCGNNTPNRELEITEWKEVSVSIDNWMDRSAMVCNYISVFVQSDSSGIGKGEDLYLVGNHNNWKLFDPLYKMKQIASGLFVGRLPKGIDILEFKVTRGDWSTVEVNEEGSISKPHSIIGSADSVLIEVPFWNDYITNMHPNLTIILRSVPPFPEEDRLFFSSNINNWDPAADGYAFEKMEGSDEWSLTFPRKGDRLYFKITRGNWATVETSLDGSDIDNREWDFGMADTAYARIASWKD